ncbi:MAG TPA: hypothetical protein VIX91_25670 [Candidatus Acidoferrum sp.]
MKAQTAFERLPISSLAVKGNCPVCCGVKHFHESLPERLRTETQPHLCNFHAWLLAKSAQAEAAASLFLNALRTKERIAIPASPSRCTGCAKIHGEEVERLKEVTRELEQNSLTGRWLKEHARFCLRHILELKKQVPSSLREALNGMSSRGVAELELELREFLQQAKQGDHSGGGVLGRAAEFLVSQRGILD